MTFFPKGYFEMASMKGVNNNSDDSDSENVGTQDKEAMLTKKERKR